MIDIVNFINNSTLEDIDKNLLNHLKYEKYCNEYFGNGNYGYVISRRFGKHMKILTTSKKNIKIDIVIKAQNREQYGLHIIIKDKKLYIYGESILFDTIILLYMKKLFFDKKSVHLQLIVGNGYCSEDFIFIILERNGLKNKHEKQFEKNMLSRNKSVLSYYTTLKDLLLYIYAFYDKNTMKIKLPNDIECDVIKLIDYIIISIIHTCKILYENNIFAKDLHFDNIFIHWLNKRSYFDDINLKDLKYIYYKNKKDIIKIETFGFIIKIGDVGNFIIKPRDDIEIYGNSRSIYDKLNNLYYIDGSAILSTIYFIKDLIPQIIFKDLVINKIDIIYPYNDFSIYNIKIDIIENILTYEQVLEKFKKYNVDNYKENKHSIIF